MSDKYTPNDLHSTSCSGHVSASNRKVLLRALILTALFMLVEVIGGLISGSLALIADAGHMLTDAGALLLAFAAVSWSSKPADSKRTYGYGRLQVLAAFSNGIALIALTLWILAEAVGRFNNPQPIQSMSMFVVAVIGLMVNLIVFKMLHSSSEDNINIRGAMLHVLGDLLGSVGAIIAALIIWKWELLWVDPLLSVLFSILILRSAYHIVKDSTHILLEGTPLNMRLDTIEQDLLAIDGVIDVHHVHLWSLNEQEPMMTFHALIEPDKSSDAVIDELLSCLKQNHAIGHATIQVEQSSCVTLDCESQGQPTE